MNPCANYAPTIVPVFMRDRSRQHYRALYSLTADWVAHRLHRFSVRLTGKSACSGFFLPLKNPESGLLLSIYEFAKAQILAALAAKWRKEERVVTYSTTTTLQNPDHTQTAHPNLAQRAIIPTHTCRYGNQGATFA